MKSINVKISTPHGNFIATVDINDIVKTLLDKTGMVEAATVESEIDWKYTNLQSISHQHKSIGTLQI